MDTSVLLSFSCSHRIRTRPPMGSGTMRAGPWPPRHISGISTAFNPGAAPPVLRAGRAFRCVIIRAVPSLVRPARADRRLDRSPARWGRVLARCGVGTAACYPHCWYALSRSSEGEVFPLSLSSQKRGWVNTPHAANFSKYFFMSRRIRSLRLMTARWVTPIRRAYSLVERWS